MAIKIASTTVINDSRGLENITNLKTVAGQSILGSGDIATGSVLLGGTGQTTYTNGQLLIGNTTGNTLVKSTLTGGTGINITNGAGSITITNSAPDQTVSLTQGGATTISGTYPNFTISSTNTTYSAATSTTPGLVELFSDTAQTVAANAVTATASRTYGIQANAAGQMVVNVPWSDTNTTYSTATSTTPGLVELFSDTAQTVAANAVTATASRTYGIQLNAAGQMVVNVPWSDTDTNTTYSTATSTTPGLVELFSDTAQTVAANAVTATAARTYGIQLNAAGQMVVNVPWTSSGTGTVTSVGGTGTVGGLTLSGTVTTTGNLTLGGSLTVATSSVAGIVSTATQSFGGAKTFTGVGHGFNASSPNAGWGVYFKGTGAAPSLVAEGSGTSGATCYVAIKNSNSTYFIGYNGTSASAGTPTVRIEDVGTEGGSATFYNSGNTAYGKIAQNSGFAFIDATNGTASGVGNVTKTVLSSADFRPFTDNGQTLGTSVTRWGQIYSSSSTISTSDSRTKYDIENLKIGLDFIEALVPSEYKVLTSTVKTIALNKATPEELAAGTITQDSITGEDIVKINVQGNRVHSGFIAQQVKQALGTKDYAIWCLDDSNDPDSRQSLRYEELISPMVKAIQELSAKVRELEARLAVI